MRASLILVAVCLALAGSAACGGDGASDDTSSDEVRGALTRRDLPRGAFRTRADELAQEWLDNNIMTGDPRLDAGALDGRLTKAALAKFAAKIVSDHLRRHEETSADIRVETPAFEESMLKAAATVVAVDGFVFDARNPDNIEPIEANVRELVRFLGDTSKLDVALLTGRATSGDEPRRITQYLFVNRETKQYLAFYAREGTT